MQFVYDDGGRKAAGYKGTCDDCVVRAIAIAAEIPYREVYKDLQADIDYFLAHGRKSKLRSALLYARATGRASVRNGVHKPFFRDYLLSLGWQWTPTMQIGSGCKVHLRSDELPSGRIIASVSKHLVAVIDGVIHDLDDCSREGTRCVYGYWQKESSDGN